MSEDADIFGRNVTLANLLVLNDHDLLVMAIGDILTNSGYVCFATPDSYEAWALLHSLPMDLFIQDLSRSDVNGQDFYQRLQQDPAICDVPVVILSASVPSLQGIAAYIQSPVKPSEVVDCVEMVLTENEQALPLVDKPELYRVLTEHTSAALIDTLNVADVVLRLSAARQLGLRREVEAIPPLLRMLEDNAESARAAAALALGRIEARDAIKPLCSQIHVQSSVERLMVARALSLIGGESAYAALASLVDDADPWISSCVRRGMAAIDRRR